MVAVDGAPSGMTPSAAAEDDPESLLLNAAGATLVLELTVLAVLTIPEVSSPICGMQVFCALSLASCNWTCVTIVSCCEPAHAGGGVFPTGDTILNGVGDPTAAPVELLQQTGSAAYSDLTLRLNTFTSVLLVLVLLP